MSTPFAGRSGLFYVGLLLIVVALAVAIWWLLRPTYVALYKEADEASQAEILATLSQRQVPYRINAKEGVIEVPVQSAAAARMYLAEDGIPTRSGIGFELFDQADYGMSEFSQKINYQRALEGELSRTIMGISEVEYARVHLTFKKNSLYQHAEEPPKASVIVRLRSTGGMNPQRVRGIQQLVASAIEGMSQERVAVLDENGQILSVSDGATAAPEHLELTAQIEQGLQEKANQLLLRPLGRDGAEVSVRVQMNFDRIKSIREQPLTEKGAIQHEKRVESNESSTGDSSSKRSQNTRETAYELGKERAEVEHAAGTIERISVGVVLSSPLSSEAQKEIYDLLEAALGLDAARGDRLVIAFMPPASASTKSDAIVPAVPALAENHPVSAYEPSTQSLQETPLPWLRLGLAAVAALLSILLFVLWLNAKRRQTQVAAALPRLSSVEREQLLVDLRRWLAEGR